MIDLKNSEEKYYFEKYGEHINSWYMTHLVKMGIINTGIQAEGATITDSKGNTLIDCTSGYGIGNIGHNNPVIVQAIIDQLTRKEVNTRPYINKIQIELADLLKIITPGELECSYLFNSGSEAIENALKLVRLYKGGKKIISMKDSFHGYTLGALSASGVPSFKKGFEPLLPGFQQVKFGKIEEVYGLKAEEIGAILIEPIQHDAGVKIPPYEYLKQVRKYCDDNNIIMVVDEVITGIGKTGYMFASEYFQIEPDILVIGKSLGAGLIPIGGIITRKNLWQRFGLSFPMTASSYSGNSLACRAAIETIRFILDNNILDAVKPKELFLSDQLNKLRNKFPEIILAVNGMGMMFGLEIINKNTASWIVKNMIKNNVIVYQSFGNASIIMVEPPLIISLEQISKIIDGFYNVISGIYSEVTFGNND
ncbi:MAG: aspartate aminotransferase family protein [Ignavibacteriaceae bacterium]|nr:aspartate aminotransferase family protein [Ignavibacteriaceae bacterium]